MEYVSENAYQDVLGRRQSFYTTSPVAQSRGASTTQKPLADTPSRPVPESSTPATDKTAASRDTNPKPSQTSTQTLAPPLLLILHSTNRNR